MEEERKNELQNRLNQKNEQIAQMMGTLEEAKRRLESEENMLKFGDGNYTRGRHKQNDRKGK